ncbi:hypothetical protein PU629_04605 [Pullulanibacillus sp. KACC 23026]|uniref:hypothetical protein n=1 Tax=Pullulanibacillus sp. KACC 23026 TaxID=3028315 RepID=UPI0023B096AA|nr:hypothetical protein [Pullulanibacillus sp. KACC 23026]WEG13651.1 hypothetical protein PU629_04605 [Pullulanibacillus sp. KACC 23026]
MSKSAFKKIVDHIILNHTMDYVSTRENVEEVINFHYSTTNLPLHNVKNLKGEKQKDRWLQFFKNNPISYSISKEKIKLNLNNFSKDADIISHEFDNSFMMDFEIIEELLVRSLKGNIGAVIPLLLVFSNSAVNGIKAGSYFIDGDSLELVKLQNWDSKLIDENRFNINNKGNIPSNLAIAYAIDIKRSLAVDGRRGYIRGLIEVGSSSNFFKECIKNSNLKIPLIDYCSLDFSGNPMTFLCGLNVRLAPIALLQWFGLRKVE